jgi:disulfide bond formation protein DsbB
MRGNAGSFGTGERLIPGAIAVICLVALAVALVAEYFFGVEPCDLCLYQRGVYATAAVIGIVALTPRIRPPTAGLMVASCGAVFLLGAGIALYHVGLQQHWWNGVTACGGTLPAEMSLADLKAQLTTVQPTRCDEVDWAIFGLSAATYNVGLFLLLAVGSLKGAHMLRLREGRSVAWRAGRVEGKSGRRMPPEVGHSAPGTVTAARTPAMPSVFAKGILPQIWYRASRWAADKVGLPPYREPREHRRSSDW